MNSRELTAKTIIGENPGRTPVYGWVFANLKDQLTEEFGSVENFEDKYEFDLAHIFGGPRPYKRGYFRELRESGTEVTPELVLDTPMLPPDDEEAMKSVIRKLDFYQKDRERFCYKQTVGNFEFFNDVFGMQDHMINMMIEPDLMKEIYQKHAEWNLKNVEAMIEAGMDMIHMSDDWGSQDDLLFSKDMWYDMVYPYHKIVTDYVKSTGTFISLHSDGNINRVLPDIKELGYDLVHPYQEAAGMSYDVYLDKYQDDFAIMGGMCVQTTLGFGDFDKVKSEIDRVFDTLKGKKWIFCTTHFVQDHCSLEELVFAFDHAVKRARE